MLNVMIPKERRPGETRVAATPETVKKMVKEGFAVSVEQGAGAGAFFLDAEYEAAGAQVTRDPDWSAADVLLQVRTPPVAEAPEAPERAGAGESAALSLRPGALLISLLAPHRNLPLVRRLADGNVTSLAMELVPRITRAQGMDALSSQASIGGYKAVLIAASRLPRYLPLLMTAAGTIKPARLVVMGAGVAGLQAVATARRLGAVVEVSDVRPAVQEQVESLGGRFIELPQMEKAEATEGAGGYARQVSEEFLTRQREIVSRHVAAADAVITTALVPGKPAPRLVTAEMVGSMRPGSVVVDLAVEEGGNCELSQADREVTHGDVLVLAPSNLPATLPRDASTLYARNVLALLSSLVKEGRLTLDTADEIVAATVLTHGGKILHAGTAELLQAVPA
ncbi:MAG TPA: Re/Si-specific NAD(P)(+) transhydrogenase subunit alpha [Thermoanaerobaculia bacterium]|nr:Re/Si-specific NAD(P)(+) transhydrogenase subunit alpha [Thermoanaerobaculia bacterium]